MTGGARGICLIPGNPKPSFWRKRYSPVKKSFTLGLRGKIDEAICFLDFTNEEFHDTLDEFSRRIIRCSVMGGVLLVSGMITRCFSRNVCGIRLPFPLVNVSAPLARQYDFTRYRLKSGILGTTGLSRKEMEMKWGHYGL